MTAHVSSMGGVQCLPTSFHVRFLGFSATDKYKFRNVHIWHILIWCGYVYSEKERNKKKHFELRISSDISFLSVPFPLFSSNTMETVVMKSRHNQTKMAADKQEADRKEDLQQRVLGYNVYMILPRTEKENQMHRNVRKRTFGHGRPAKIQISLRIRTV